MEQDPSSSLPDIEPIAALIASRASAGVVLIVGVTGSVAAGKSTLCEALKSRLAKTHRVEVVSTDGFLLPNQTLAARGLTLRKGYPESYDIDALTAAVAQVRVGPVVVPGYSHITYDIEPALARTLDRPNILLLDGLGLAPRADGRNAADGLDLLIYLDASEADLEAWFVRRFLGFCKAAESDPASFYAQFLAMTPAEVDTFARTVWSRINLPNLREHIVLARDAAEIVVRKAADHSMTLARP